MVIFWVANAGIQFSGGLNDNNSIPTVDNINEKYNNIDIILPTLNIIKIKFYLIMSYL